MPLTTFGDFIIENFLLELIMIACATPLVTHAIRAEIAAKYCTLFGVPAGLTYHTMVFHPRYWHLWTVHQWKTFVEIRQNKRRRSAD
ncbi:hypothetical protein DIE15_08265 [Burkholderia sp. Bp9031]|uniref:hypothetical protein n=1 Tax=Burkholderia sp. Bp9031 TaxID=2184566 RepID=UPI000F5F259B|nr:hypothetical protein [Burkholderia sp. Bp9031]RQZ18118.1 hypothetical protein DIE15_08265 [Burkholderia sp. Bp9031]